MEEFLNDPRYQTAEGREAHVEQLKAAVQACLNKYTTAEGVELLERNGVPAARVRSLPEAMADPHFRHRGTLRPMRRHGEPTPVADGIVAGFPVLFSGGELPHVSGGAPLGHHNEEVFADLLDLGPEELAELISRGVV